LKLKLKPMANKTEWQEYLEIVEAYAKDLKSFVHDLPEDGEVSLDGPGSNPPPPPPPPPGS